MTEIQFNKINMYLIDVLENTDDKTCHNAVRGIKWVLEQVMKGTK
jgi:hypothetical protein